MMDPSLPFEQMHHRYQSILACIAQGMTMKDTAAACNVSVPTVDRIRKSPAGCAFLNDVSRKTAAAIVDARLKIATAAARTVPVFEQVALNDRTALDLEENVSLTHRMEAARYLNDSAGVGAGASRNHPARSGSGADPLAIGVYTDERRLAVVLNGPPPDLFTSSSTALP